MPRKKPDADFNTTIHDIYERIGAGESSHDDAPKDEVPSPEPEKPKKPEKVFDPTVEPAKWLGQRGGKKGGKTRTESMTPEERKELAKKAAEARWSTKNKSGKKTNNC